MKITDKNDGIWLEKMSGFLSSELSPKEVTIGSTGLTHSLAYSEAPVNTSCSETQLSVWRHPRWREKDIRYPGARVRGDYEQVWCWEANPGPLQEQVSQKAIFTSETSLSHSFKARSLGLIWNVTAFPYWLQTLKQNKTAQTLSWMK